MKVRFPARAWVTLASVVLVAVLLVQATRLGRLAGLVPFWVAVPTLGLLAVALLLDCFPGLFRALQSYQRLRLGRTETLMLQAAPDLKPGEKDRISEEPGVALWTLALPGAVLLLGFVAGGALYILFSLRLRAGVPWWKTALVAGATGGSLVALSAVLHTPLYSGALW